MEFGQAVEKTSAEEALSLSTTEGHMPFDTTWVGSRVIVSPLEPWQPGMKYVFACKGVIATPDDRSFQVNVEVSFYVDTDNNPPALRNFTPASDSVVSPESAITLQFNLPVRDNDLEKHILIAPDHDITITISEDNATITISPDVPWQGLTRYEWTILETLTGLSGTPVLEEYRGTFRTNEDLFPPETPTVLSRVIHEENATPQNLDMIENGDGILLRYNEAVNFESLKSGVEIEPVTTLRYRQLNNRDFLIFPEDERWIAGQEYTMTVKEGIEDIAGNKTQEELAFSFTPVIPELHITSVENSPDPPSGSNTFSETEMQIDDYVQQISVDTLLDKSHYFFITLSEPITASEAQRFVDSVSFEPLFPYSLGKPDLLSVSFTQATNTIHLRYIKIDVPNTAHPEERAFYTFSIAGGKTGFTTDSGSFFPESLSIILETFDSEG